MPQVSFGEEIFALQIKGYKLEGWHSEYRFDLTRRWRFDFAHLGYKIAVEIEGGSWSRGRHNRGAGFSADCEKYAEAAIAGWTVLRATTEQVKSGELIGWVLRLINVNGG